jgi:spermidine synthase
VSIIGQGVILREITTLFYGNELFYGLGLGLWLLFTGLGSLWATKMKWVKNSRIWAWLILGSECAILPVLIIGLRYLVSRFIAVGQIPSLTFSLWFLIIILAVFCLPLGAIFPLAVNLGRGKKKLVNRAYFWETIGLACGGLIFSFGLATTTFPLTPKLNRLTLSWRYQNLTGAINTKYNQIITTQKGEQVNFYINGRLAVTSGEKFETKQFLSLITPFVKDPQSCLVLGNPNLASELKNKFPKTKIDYLEMDKELINLEKGLLAKEVNPISADAKIFLDQNPQSYDLIIFTPGNPQTLLTNRYFTQETFGLVSKHLKPQGVFGLAFYIPTDYQSQEALHLAASVYQTMKSVFPYRELLTPEDQLVLIGSKAQLQINPPLSPYFEYQINQPQRMAIWENIGKQTTKINSDLEPVTFFYQQLFWQTMFSFSLPGLTMTGLYLGLILVVIWFGKVIRKAKYKLNLGLVVGSSGFMLMSLETLIIFLVQTKIGFLYSQICLIFAATLSGMAVGVKMAEQFKKFTGLLIMAFAAYLVIAVSLGINVSGWPVLWWGMSFILGVIGGLIFATVNTMYLKRRNNPGYIYAADLLGSSAGAILTASLILPIYGVRGLIWGCGLLILSNFKLISKLRR